MAAWKNRLFYGDNLEVLRQHLPDDSVDLIYLDPPFKSDQNYNVLFEERDGTRAAAQIKAFEDTWTWDQVAAQACDELIEGGGSVADAMRAFKTFLGQSDMMAYLAMMAPRLVELRRVLKASGTLYLHCDPTASHYLKMLLDAVFGPQQFLSEVVWRRTGTHSSARRWGPVHDVLLSYSRTSGQQKWTRLYVPLSERHRQRHYRMSDDEGRVYTHGELTAPGVRNGRSGLPWHGFDVSAMGRHWCTTIDKLDKLDAAGRIYWPEDRGWPRLVRFAEESKGRALGDVWEDIPPLNMKARERLGYPTQKPEALLERIVLASSAEGDLVLDPFCGCGTTIAAAEKLKRRWIGIDITHLAIGLIRHRLVAAYGAAVEEAFNVIGEPVSLPDAHELARTDPFQFQAWALGLVGARTAAPVKKGADRGVDGRLFFHDEGVGGKTKLAVFSVKGGHLKASDVRELAFVIDRERAALGALICLEEPSKRMRADAAEAGSYLSPWTHQRHAKLQIITIRELLGGHRFDYPGGRQTNVTFKSAPRARTAAHKQVPVPLEPAPALQPPLFDKDKQPPLFEGVKTRMAKASRRARPVSRKKKRTAS